MTIPDRLALALADRYRIERPLGAGGMATVYLAADLKHDRRVAIKVLKPELAAVLGAERFVQEIKTTAALSHPHILPLFDSGEADSFLYYVMPYIEGETIRDRLNRDTQLSITESVRITREIADALDYAHRHGVIHRDIKPENLLLHDGRAMVMDFGIALAVSAAAGGRMTETGLSLGTPHYMSPEQATADKSITARSDVYSLASVCYEMLTGSPPHVGSSAQQIIMKIIAEPVQAVTALRKSVPPNVASALAKALEKMPADRFDTAKEFAEALSDTGFTVATTVASAAGGFARGPRQQMLLAAALLVGAVLGAAAMWGAGSAPQTPAVVKFTFEVQRGWTLERVVDTDAAFALSPDGRRIAYIAADSTTRTPQLFVRDLDHLEPRLLSGAVQPSSPFFSPDGKWVGYFTTDDNALYKIPVDGGPPIRLVNDARIVETTGYWNTDGWILYTSVNRGLSRVRASGGESTRLTVGDSGVWVGMPFGLPGGESALLTACPAQGACVVTVVNLTSGARRDLIQGGLRGWYLDGLLIYALEDGSVLAAPFDPARGEITGAASPLFSEVAIPTDAMPRLTVSASGGMMFQPRTESQSEVELLEVDRTGRPTERLRLRGAFQSPRLSPAGDRVAVTRNDQRENGIWIYDLRSKTFSPVAEGQGARPAWSPDGRSIAFQRVVGSEIGIYTVPVDGSAAATNAVPNGPSNGTPSWSRDGQWIIFDGPFAEGMGEDIYAVGTGEDRTAFPVVQSPATEEAGVVSPDGRWIAYTADESRTTQVYVRPFRREGGRWLISPAGAAGPLWTTNSELVYHDLAANTIVAAKLAFTPDPQVLSRQTLFDARGYYRSTRSLAQYDVSRDGQRFVVIKGGDQLSFKPPVVVLNWLEEIKRVMQEQGAER